MKLHTPIIITSRLLPGVRFKDSMISIEYGSMTDDNRQAYTVHIDAPDFSYTFHDLHSGVGGGDLQNGLESALSFLSAAGEDYRIHMGENPSEEELFPVHVCEWAYQNSDELSMMQYVLEENKNMIEE